MINAVIFDFGGVMAEEGFREGIMAIAERRKLDGQSFFRKAENIIYNTGYVIGKAPEKVFWETLLKESGLKEDFRRLRPEILRRFLLRPSMLSVVDRLRESGLVVALLSDQTNWLDEINRKKPFYGRFDFVINSYVLGKSKRDLSTFREAAKIIGVKPHLILFVDDNISHVQRAEKAGMRAIHFESVSDFTSELEALLPGK